MASKIAQRRYIAKRAAQFKRGRRLKQEKLPPLPLSVKTLVKLGYRSDIPQDIADNILAQIHKNGGRPRPDLLAWPNGPARF